MMLILGVVIPFPVLAVRTWRTPLAMAVSGLSINVGMWLERYTIIVPGGAHPYLTWGTGSYHPSWVEWSITAGWISGFLLLLMLFTRFFPVLTVWEIQEGLEPHRLPSIELAE